MFAAANACSEAQTTDILAGLGPEGPAAVRAAHFRFGKPLRREQRTSFL